METWVKQYTFIHIHLLMSKEYSLHSFKAGHDNVGTQLIDFGHQIMVAHGKHMFKREQMCLY